MPTPRYRATNTPSSTANCSTTKVVTKQLYTTYFNPATATTTTTPSVYTKTVPGAICSIYDWVTPDFHKVVKTGRVINNPLNVNKVEETNPSIDIDYTRVTNYKMLDVTNGYTVGIFPLIVESKQGTIGLQNLIAGSGKSFLSLDNQIDLDRLRSIAVTSAWANAKESDILALATAKETSKTIRSLHSLSKQVIRIISAVKNPLKIVKHLTFKQAKKAYNEAEEIYMQARYNLRPLYYDILGVMKLTSDDSLIKRSRRSNFNRYSIRGRECDTIESSDSFDFTSSILPSVNLRLHRKTSWEAEVRAGVLCQAGDWTKWDQMGLYLIPETLWELVPFSFILDWFGNVGDLISSWLPQPGVQTLTSWATTETVLSQQLSIEILGYSDSAPHSQNVGQIWDTSTTCSLLGDLTACKVSKQINRIPNPSRPYTPFLRVYLDLPKLIDLAIIGKNLKRATTTLKTTPSPKRRGIATMDWSASNGRYY